MTSDNPSNSDFTDEEKRARVCRLAVGGDHAKLDEFCKLVKESIPHGTAVVLRCSVVTGRRGSDGARFDADGPGTSDPDRTLLGEDVVGHVKVAGFIVPGIHSRPLSDDDPDIAPDLVPLRKKLIEMTGRPVNIQGTRDWVMYFRGEMLGQPYLTLVEKEHELDPLA